jgi:hypothetical protein
MMAVEIGIPAMIDPCPSCQVPLLMVELFAVDGPPKWGGQAHVRAHAADCPDRSASDSHPAIPCPYDFAHTRLFCGHPHCREK